MQEEAARCVVQQDIRTSAQIELQEPRPPGPVANLPGDTHAGRMPAVQSLATSR